ETGLIAALTVAVVAVIVATGGGGAALGPLEAAGSIEAIAVATGIGVSRVATLALAAFAVGGVGSFVGSFVELLCKEGGYCD
ncbi:MAG TPA: hypothetical protein VKT70_10430, partial [Stellaceae bacterium]|nr:hypothetical protein [Stellaceae bacterium]